MTSYASWSVVFGEQPSAAKWNILGTNDAAFNDGTGIFGLYKNLLAVDSNPYKFRARRVAAFTPGSSGAFVLIPHDTEDFDTNSNFDSVTNKGRYTAPVAGFYHINGYYLNGGASGTLSIIALYKNGAQYQIGSQVPGAVTPSSNYSDLVQSAASDYWELFIFNSTAVAATVSAGNQPYFSGGLFCRT